MYNDSWPNIIAIFVILANSYEDVSDSMGTLQDIHRIISTHISRDFSKNCCHVIFPSKRFINYNSQHSVLDTPEQNIMFYFLNKFSIKNNNNNNILLLL